MFDLRQNRQKHSEEALGLADFGEAVIGTKSLSSPGSQRFLSSPYIPIPDLYSATPRQTKTFPRVQFCPVCLTLPQAAAPFLPQSPSKAPLHLPMSLQDCRGVRQGRVKQCHQHQLLSFTATEAIRTMQVGQDESLD